jgi:integrase
MRAIGKGLPKQPKKDGHFAALPYTDVPALMTKLAATDTMGRLALRFTILTAARSGETRGATWGEIDLDKGIWTVPADRMKAGRVHVVPLSAAALAVLATAKGDRKEVGAAEFVFPGNLNKRLSDMTLTKALKAATAQPATVHGFRSSFRDWAAEEQIGVSDAIVEAALAHTNPNKVEAAYRRTNYFDQRKELMEAWSKRLIPTTPKLQDLQN